MSKTNKWVKIGECAVDSGTIMLVDPCYVLPDKIGDIATDKDYTYEDFLNDFSGGLLHKDILDKCAVVLSTGFGDGCYPVYALISDEGDWGKRVKEVKIKFF